MTTAVPLEDSLSLEWERVLGSVTGLQVRLKREVDPGIIGGAVLGRTSAAIETLGAELAQTAGGKPDASKISQMAALQERTERWTRIDAILVSIAVICMAIAGALT